MELVGGKYRVGKRLGGGGMAVVFDAELVGDRGFARKVAVKKVLAKLSSEPRFGEMFANEARLASLLHHPNIVSVLDFDRDEDGCHYLVMEKVDGVDLNRLLKTSRLPFAVSAFIIAEVLRGLAYAHELIVDGKHLGIVHRDVSPQNVMISWAGAVKLVDFGLAKAFAVTDATTTRGLKGKVAYMSPEQARMEPELDGRSDLFAVGVMLHELLTGQRLFRGATVGEMVAAVLSQPIPRPREVCPDVPADLDELTMALLRRDVGERIISARVALEELLGGETSSARAPLDLRDLLAERFPDEAPKVADLSGPAAAERGESIPEHTLSDVVGAPAEPTPAPSPPARGSIVLLLGAALVALLSLYVATRGGQSPRARPSIASPDSAAMVPSPDAGPMALNPDAMTMVTNPQPVPRQSPADPAVPPTGSTDSNVSGRAVAATGVLVISVEPWAQVTIDGRDAGVTPLRRSLAPGRYRIRLVNEDANQSETISVTIEARRTHRIRRKWGTPF